jgi:hypothetical protein
MHYIYFGIAYMIHTLMVFTTLNHKMIQAEFSSIEFPLGGYLNADKRIAGSPTLSLVMERRLENIHVPYCRLANLTTG